LAVVGLLSPAPGKNKPKEPPTAKRIELAQAFNEWLGKGGFISKLIATLDDPKKDPEACIHAAEVLKELIEVATRHIPRQLPPPRLFQDLLSERSVAELVPYVLSLQSEQVFSAGVAVILELLKYEGLSDKRKPGEPAPTDKKLSPLLIHISKHVEKLVEKLKDAPLSAEEDEKLKKLQRLQEAKRRLTGALPPA